MFKGLGRLNRIITDARKQVQEQGQTVIKEAFAELFAAHPELEAVKWTQYTPYFNDGEPCTFSVNEWSAKIKGVTLKYQDEEGFSERWDFRDAQAYDWLIQDIDRLFKLADDDAMEATFGDHVEVVATRDGFDVDEYSHD